MIHEEQGRWSVAIRRRMCGQLVLGPCSGSCRATLAPVAPTSRNRVATIREIGDYLTSEIDDISGSIAQ